MNECVFSSLCASFVPQAETRAEFAERSVAKLEKTIDDLEGMTFCPFTYTWVPLNSDVKPRVRPHG